MMIPLTTHLASAALPAAGAYTSQTVFDVPEGCKELIVTVTYTRGAVGGFPRFRPQLTFTNPVTAATVEGRSVVIDSGSLTTSNPNAQYDTFLEEIDGPSPSAAGVPDVYDYRFEMRGGVTGFRLLASEAGVVGTPGTCGLQLAGSD